MPPFPPDTTCRFSQPQEVGRKVTRLVSDKPLAVGIFPGAEPAGVLPITGLALPLTGNVGLTL